MWKLYTPLISVVLQYVVIVMVISVWYIQVIAHSADVDVSREKSTTSTTATAATKSGSKNSGVSIYDVTVRESGAIFRFNFRDVYWNSR
jgi:biopolymer transport protein ExbD